MTLEQIIRNLQLDLRHAADEGDITTCDILHGEIAAVETTMVIADRYEEAS